jgi:hypothetical protein
MKAKILPLHGPLGLDELFDRFPELSIRPSHSPDLAIAGTIEFQTTHRDCGTLTESFDLEIRVPQKFPRVLPTVSETQGRIPSTFHHNGNRELCLGSLLRLQLIVQRNPTLLGFLEGCVIPYLINFAVSKRTGNLPFGELKHGARGLLDDYRSILHANSDQCCLGLLELLKIKKRIANKRPCPCASGRRLGRCHNKHLNRLRRQAPRSQFSVVLAELRQNIAAERRRRPVNRPS